MSPIRKLVVKAAGLLAATGIVLVAVGQQLPSEEELYSKGTQSFREKSFKPAVEAFEELLKRFPKSPRAREVQYLAAEAYRIARQFGRESTYEKADKAYQVLTEAPTEDLWKFRAQAGLARLHTQWNYWGNRDKVNALLEAAMAGFEKVVKKESEVGLKRELAEVYIDRVQAGMNELGYMSPDQVKEMMKQREDAKKAAEQGAQAAPAAGAAPAPAPAQRRAAQMEGLQAPVPPRPRPGPVAEQDEQLKKRLEWYARVDALIAKIDALGAGKDLEAKARWTVAQRSGTEEYALQIIEKYADTEYWDEAVFHVASRREGQGKFLEALAYYEKLTQRFNDQQSRYSRQARQRAENIRKPVLSVNAQYACMPGMKPTVNYSWRNQDKATFRIFRTEPFGQAHFTSLLEMARAGKGTELKTWDVPLENKKEHEYHNAEQTLDLAEEGAYLVTADGGGVHADTLVLVTRLAVVTKSASDKTVAYVADALSGEPVAGADAQIAWTWWENNAQRWADAKGTSNDGGFYTFAHGDPQRHHQYYLLARKGNSFAFSTSYRGWWQPMQPGLWFYGYTDRPAYRPEEEVQFKFIVRNYDGNVFQNAAGQQYRVIIHEPQGGKLYEKVLTTNDMGTLADSVKLAKEPKLGQYNVQIRRPDNQGNVGSAAFRVEEYKLPEYKVEITTSKDTYRVGDKLELRIAANYYFGGPVQEAEVEAVVKQGQYWHFYQPYRKYAWYYEDAMAMRRGRWGRGWGGGETVVKTEKLKTDAHGVATLTVETPALPDDPAQQRDYTYSVEARVVDKSRREITGSKSIRVTVKPFYVYVNPKNHVYLPGDRVEINVVAKNANDAPVKTEGMFRVFRATYNADKEKQLQKDGKPYDVRDVYDLKELQAEKMATKDDGTAMAAFTPDEPGYLLLEMTALTEKEEKVIGTGWAWVASKKDQYLGVRLSGVQVIPDKQTYKKGETAQVLLVSQFPDAHVWLGIEGDQIYDSQLVPVRERSKLITVPIKDEYSPNMFLTANLVKDAMLWRHQSEIVVPPEDRFIDVKITTAKKTYLPGETAQFEVTATNHKGQPVAAELSLGLVDSSVYYIQSEYAPDIRQFFYGRKRQLAINTNSSFSWIRHKRVGEDDEKPEARPAVGRELQESGQRLRGGLGGGGFDEQFGYADARRAMPQMAKAAAAPEAEFAANGAMAGRAMDRAEKKGFDKDGGPAGGPEDLAEAVMREDFRATAFWQPAIKTDATGKAIVQVKFPDSLTDWTATARAVTPDTAVGNVTFSTQTKKNIIVRLQCPRFFQEKDSVTLSAIVHNYLDVDKDVKVTMKQSGLSITQAPVVTVKVPKGGEQRVDWLAQVTEPGEAKIQVMAQTDVESDAMGKTFAVLPHGVEKFLAKSGSVGEPVAVAEPEPGKSPPLKSEAVETLTLPAERNNLATVLNIDLSPSIASTMLGALDYLAQYPYGCVEQTLSRFVPAVVTAKTLRDLGVRNPALEAKLPDMITKGLDRIYGAQRGDGGWGWWGGAPDSDPWMTAYATYALTIAKQAGVNVDDARLQRGIGALRANLVQIDKRDDVMAYALYVLSQHKISDARRLDAVWNRRENLNAYTRALAALAFHNLGDNERARIMLRNLEDRLELDKENGTARWGKTHGYWHWSDDAVEATSYALKAYLAIEPKNPLVKQAMKWLVYNRKGNQWKSTRDTAKAVYALADYVQQTRELDPNYKVTVFVNDKPVKELVVNKDNALKLDGRITLGDSDLKSGENKIRIVKEGAGNLYYTTGMYFYTKEEKITGAGNELFVNRTYAKLALDKDNKEVRTPLAYGAALNSGDRIEVTLDIEAKNDYEYLVFEDPKASGCEPVEIRSGWHWGGGLSAYMEVRDVKTAFFVSHLPQGKHKLTYVLRAEVPGTFNALPTAGYAMYVPDIRGLSDEWRVKIGERPAPTIGMLR